MNESDSITKDVQKFQELRIKLLAIDIQIKDKGLITNLFNDLLDLYLNFLPSFFVSSLHETLNFEEVVGLLIHEEQKLEKLK